jgi:hypothetical protein
MGPFFLSPLSLRERVRARAFLVFDVVLVA